MHISEGVLSWPVLAGGAAIAAAAVGVGLRRLPDERIPVAGLLCALFFVAALIHIPVGIASVHLVLNGLCGVLLGWAAFPVIAAALTLQALLFGFGGLSTLGVNILVMGVPALIAAAAFRAPWPRSAALRGAVCGALAIVCGVLLMALALWLSGGAAFASLIGMVMLAHLPVIAIEAAMTAAIVGSLQRARPALLQFRVSA
ncbi:cobalt transporter CbiM [Methyloversatilis discipulorum]|uniref:cobalt transporter CbiM n=1 Tax=Methyloversatilis discipulorum TaxID=1119528 RepID=UPI001A481729|nr:cobalt transporter CbiM [Methyloversatilis discipulorum]MBL8466166.1 cobalt transporter CbiM [Methyloversatilis discipulorum]